MKPPSIAATVTTIILLALPVLASTTAPTSEQYVARNLVSMPLAFTQNNGQWDDRVLFRADAGLATVWITKEGVYYQFTRRISKSDEKDLVIFPHALGYPDDLTVGASGRSPVPDDRFDLTDDSVETMVIKATFVGANINLSAAGEDVMEYKCNYFLGNDPSKWRRDVPNFRSVTLKEVYPGIDLRYFGNGDGKLEYDFVVSPGVDPSQIAVRYDGAKSVSVNDAGELVVGTGWNTVVERRPEVYQIDGNTRCAILGTYTLRGDNTFGFTLDETYDPTLALVIDPALVYSTYLGGGNDDRSMSITVDNSGCAYATGSTASSDFPMQNPYDGSYNGGDIDVFVTKLSAPGDALLYSTYLGGSDDDYSSINGIAVDNAGCAYLTGTTLSSDFPTQNPYDDSYNGDYEDAFVVKLSASGSELAYSTYLGGVWMDWGLGIAVDTAGCAYLTGRTNSYSDFPTQNPYDSSANGMEDAFVLKLSASGSVLVYGTYLGGDDYDEGFAIAVDNAGCAYLVGMTWSSDFPTRNPYDSSYNGGYHDAFVVKLSASGSALVYSTYLGSSGFDYGLDIAVDTAGCAYLTGWTTSSDFPIQNPYDGSFNGGYHDAFIAKLSASGNALMYSTYLGGGGDDEGRGIAVDNDGCVYLTGKTTSADLPTPIPCGGSLRGPSDGFAAKLSASGSALVYSTYLGGGGDDEGYGIAIDTVGCAYLTGWTVSTDFPIQNPYDGGFNGGTSDAFVTKLSRAPEYVCGDANSDCAVNLADAVYIINYVFKGGPAPDPECVGDANGDDAVNLADAVYLINYVFKDGAAPVEPCCP